MIRVEREGSVAVVVLDGGVINPIGPALVELLDGMICGLREDPEVRGLVLASGNDKFFSIGFELPVILDFDEQAMASFYDRFCGLSLDLYTWPGPTAAAISGHAIAGGCILALCCDYRVAPANRCLIGLNEVALGVPVPHLPQLILTELCGARYSRDLLDAGELIFVQPAVESGLVDLVVAPEEVRNQAVARVAELAALPPEAFAAIKVQRVEEIAERVREAHEAKRDEFVRLWFSPEARELLAAARERF
jgi:enoyl-CoA hydratase/carnithine racemase